MIAGVTGALGFSWWVAGAWLVQNSLDWDILALLHTSHPSSRLAGVFYRDSGKIQDMQTFQEEMRTHFLKPQLVSRLPLPGFQLCVPFSGAESRLLSLSSPGPRTALNFFFFLRK